MILFEENSLRIMENPFNLIVEKLSSIEVSLAELKNREVPKSKPEHRRLTRKEVSRNYKVSLGTIHNLMRSGDLPFEKIGRKTLFKQEDVEQYFESQKRKAK